jgi:hypothetical protein
MDVHYLFETLDEDPDVEVEESRQQEAAALPSSAKEEVKQLLFEDPSKALLALLSEVKAEECRQKTSIWIREQKLQGRLTSLMDGYEPACQRWVEEMRPQWLKEIFRELEALRTYRATAEEDIHRAIRSINASMAASMRFSHH